jgi:hypothetical protein
MPQQMAQEDVQRLPAPPAELLRGDLRRLGEGIGKVVYASDHWVVKRERRPAEIVALIVLWRAIRKFEWLLPSRIGHDLLQRPSRQIRILRLLVQACMTVMPQRIWFTERVLNVWRSYQSRSIKGEKLAQEHLAGTPLVPLRVSFPATRVKVKGWPGWVMVSEATERAECTLYERLLGLAERGRFAEMEQWLDRLLELRRSGWSRGLFSTDAHLKNFGVIGNRIVLLDSGGLTDEWPEVESRLAVEESIERPHEKLGLGAALASHPEIAQRFDERWKATVNRDVVQRHWPDE